MKFNININEKTRKKTKLISKITATVFTGIFTVSMFAGAIMLENADAINSVLNLETQIRVDDPNAAKEDKEYYKSAFRSVKEVKANGARYAETIEAEGATLLKNNNALPLKEGAKVSLYSTSSVDMVSAGTGSSGSSSGDEISMKEGVEVAGLQVNDDLYNWYQANKGVYGRKDTGKGVGTRFFICDAPWDKIPEAARTKEADAAIMVISRVGGEGRDPAMFNANDVAEYSNDSTQGNYLKLSPTEISVLDGLKNLKEKGKVGKSVVLLNTANHVECKFIEDYNIDAALWVGLYGERGAYVMGGLNSLGVMWCNQQGFMNTVLRGEFGMTGHVVTDSLSYHNGNFSQSLLYGTEIPDGTYNGDMDFAKPAANGKGAYAEYAWAMREAAHRILYTTIHSNAMNSFSASTKLIFVTPWWQHAVIALETVTGLCLGLSLVAWGGVVFLDFKDKRDKQKLAKEGTENEEVV